jgi:hypothetical protein
MYFLLLSLFFESSHHLLNISCVSYIYLLSIGLMNFPKTERERAGCSLCLNAGGSCFPRIQKKRNPTSNMCYVAQGKWRDLQMSSSFWVFLFKWTFNQSYFWDVWSELLRLFLIGPLGFRPHYHILSNQRWPCSSLRVFSLTSLRQFLKNPCYYLLIQ